MAEQINKSRLNELLGIKEGQSFDDYIHEGTSMGSGSDDTQKVIEQTTALINETKAQVADIDSKFNDDFATIDATKARIEQNGGVLAPKDSDGSAAARIDDLVNVENAFRSIEDLVDTTKQMISNVYGIISSCDVLDSETVGAAASLIGETRQLLSEYTSLYKQRVKFFDNVKMEMLKQKHRLEVMERKYELDRMKWNDQHPATDATAAQVVDGAAVPDGSMEFDACNILDMLSKMDKDDGMGGELDDSEADSEKECNQS